MQREFSLIHNYLWNPYYNYLYIGLQVPRGLEINPTKINSTKINLKHL